MKIKLAMAAAVFAFSVPGHAVDVIWADWTSSTSTTVSGTLATTTPISITFTSPVGFQFVQTNGAGTNYWVEPNPARKPFTSGVVTNAPPDTDIIALGAGSIKTIDFGEAISGLYIALVSWNGNVVTFDQPFTKISEGQGFWGDGSFNSGASNFVGQGEPHGILFFPGTFSTLSFTDTTEGWHGLTVGVERLAREVPGAVPEPASWAMMIGGFALAGFAMRTRRKVALSFG